MQHPREYFTLPELREQAAAGWQETYTDKYGRMAQVDIDMLGEETELVLRADAPEFVEYRYDHNG